MVSSGAAFAYRKYLSGCDQAAYQVWDCEIT